MMILGDNREVLKGIKDDSIDLIITSPPYKNVDGYTEELITDVFTELYRVQKSNTLFFLNFGHLAEDKFRPFRVCDIALSVGYKLNDTFTWVKNHYKPIQGHKRVNNLTEFVFLLYKNKMAKLNRLEIGIPYKDKTNAKRFNEGMDIHCGGNVWYINYETINKKSKKLHNDRYPLELPTKCIKLCGYEVNDILDPFAGSGTTCMAAKSLNKNYIGIEIDKNHYDTAIKRLNI